MRAIKTPKATVSNHLAFPQAGTNLHITSFHKYGPNTKLITRTIKSGNNK